VEISGLANPVGQFFGCTNALSLHVALLTEAEASSMVMACDVKAFERLSYLFGDALVRIGDNADYMGSEVVPAMLEVSRSVDALMAESKPSIPERRMKARTC